ncbi:hypothetical protein T492DRAFT_125666 [Pavlovales sp. CCMP2436]|nr:hypothetical protein T492DRAFT_125666 [Pavlovales sp. CCMP2436]
MADSARERERARSGKPRACDEPGCKYGATTASHLTAHKRTHSLGAGTEPPHDAQAHAQRRRPFVCDEPGCEYCATTAGGLTAHKRTHSGEQPFACDEPRCGYRATTVSTLTTHKHTHSGERPFACDEPSCGYRPLRRATSPCTSARTLAASSSWEAACGCTGALDDYWRLCSCCCSPSLVLT